MSRLHRCWLRSLVIFAGLSVLSGPVSAEVCGTFEWEPTPNPGTTGNALVSVAASNDGTAWAIGSRSGPATLPLILYFDGITWTEFPVPPEVEGIAFSAAGSTPEGDVWLAGTRPHSVYEREDRPLERLRQVLLDSASAPHAIYAAYHDLGPFRLGTICSIVMDLPRREAWVTAGNPLDQRFERIGLES